MTDAKILIIQDEHSSAKHLEKHLKGTAFHLYPRIEAHAAIHLEECLIALGYTVCASVSSAQEAIEKAAEMHPDLALIDLEPLGDADGVAEQLSADIPVIFLTDGSEGDLLQRAEAARPFGYVLKPYEEQQLHLTIQTALSMHKREKKHKQTEREMEQKIDELQHQAQRMETILESLSDGVIAVDENGNYLTFNSSAKRIIGSYRPGTDLNRRSEEYGLFFPDRVTLFPSADLPLTRAIHGESSDAVEIFVRNPNLPEGTYISASGRPLPPDKSGTKGGVIVFRDISKDKETDAKLEQAVGELRDQTQLMETVLENINNGVVLSDATNRILSMNASAKRILGIESDTDIPDIPVNERSETYGIFYADGKTRVPTDHLPLVRAVKGEKTEEITLFVRNEQNADGTYVRSRGIPVLSSDGTMVKAGLAILRDFTEHEKIKKRLAQLDGESPDHIHSLNPSLTDNNGNGAKADSPDVAGTQMAENQEQIIEDLREQLQLMEAICDNLNEGIIVVSPMGEMLFVNKTVERVFGTWIVTPDQNEWSKTFGVYYPHVKTPIPVEQLPLTRALYGEETDEMEIFVRNQKNPEGTYISARGRPIFSSDESTIVAGLTVFRDLTEKKEADAKLEQANREQQHQAQLLETVFNSISDGVVVADAKGQFTIFNPSAEQIVGIGMLDIPPEQWTNQYGIFFPDQKTHVPTDQLPLVRAIQGHNTDDMELFIRNEQKPDGVYISVSGRPLQKDIDGHGGGVIAFHDITARKIAEAKLEQTARKLRNQNELVETAFNNISDGVVIYDLSERSLHLNSSVTQITGIEGVTVPLIEWSRANGVFYPDQKTLIKIREHPLTRILFRGESIDDEDMFIRNEKKPEGVYVRASGRPLYNEDDVVRGAVITFRDITEQMINEEALARAFAQGRLEILDTILHNIGNAINSVTAGIETVRQHLVENPLIHRLCALAEAIKAHRDDWDNYIQNDPQGQQALPFVIALAEDFSQQDAALIKTVNRVKDRADHIADIIRTQETVNGPNMNLKDIDLQHALSMAIKVLQESLDKRGIETVIDCEDTVPKEIRIQESNFHQMMVNLIKNSIEAIDDLAAAGGLNAPPRIHIRVYVRGNTLTIEVEDNGIGIGLDVENIRRIFASGYTTKESGSGLGLYSVANFVISSGGQIRALSDGIGKGTTMRIKLGFPSLLSFEKVHNSTYDDRPFDSNNISEKDEPR